MNLTIEHGTTADIDELAAFYDDLIDYMNAGTNYPGWIKGIYPIRQTAVDGAAAQTLYVARHEGKIVGSIILNHTQAPAYATAQWGLEAADDDVLVVHTLVVHPNYPRCGIGERLIALAAEVAAQMHLKTVRLDVYEKNKPAIKLYEKSGFRYVGTVSLGFECYGRDWYKLYEKLL